MSRPVNHQPRPLTIVFPTRPAAAPKGVKQAKLNFLTASTDVAKTWEKFRRLERLSPKGAQP